MVGYNKVYWVLWVFGLLWPSFSSAASPETPLMYIDCVLEKTDLYEREPVSMVVTLKSSSPDISSADLLSPPSIAKGSSHSLRKIDYPGSSYKEVIDGKTYYCFPLQAYSLSLDKKGSYKISGGEYSVGVSYPVVVNDPFWGPRRTYRVKRIPVDSEVKSLKVKALPSPPHGFDFSGSVGDFEIETILPKGDIYVNEEATAYVVIKGHGSIEESAMPEYRSAFSKNMTLRSVSESSSQSVRRGKPVSELQLECTFIPTSRTDVEIGEISFSYFDPGSGQYKTVTSSPVKVNVKSSTARRENLEI